MRHLALFLTLLLLSGGCQVPPPPIEPPIVKPSDLVASYRDQPHASTRAYDLIEVLVPFIDYRAEEDTLCWYVGAKQLTPPALICEFRGGIRPPHMTGKVIWVLGTCQGKVRDDQVRDAPNTPFYVRLTDCRLAAAPTTRLP